MVWQGSPHRWAGRCGHLALTCTHTHIFFLNLLHSLPHTHTQTLYGHIHCTYTHTCTCVLYRDMNAQIKLFLSSSTICPLSSLHPFLVLPLSFSLSPPLCAWVPMLCSLVSVITREGEQIRVFTRQDVYMGGHTCCLYHRARD